MHFTLSVNQMKNHELKIKALPEMKKWWYNLRACYWTMIISFIFASFDSYSSLSMISCCGWHSIPYHCLHPQYPNHQVSVHHFWIATRGNPEVYNMTLHCILSVIFLETPFSISQSTAHASRYGPFTPGFSLYSSALRWRCSDSVAGVLWMLHWAGGQEMHPPLILKQKLWVTTIQSVMGSPAVK